jgi:four helix bundle protein
MRVSVDIYKLFRECKDYGFRDQIQRASVSVSSNIAEGFERQTDKEFALFLFIAKGSNGELRTQLYLAIEFGYIDKQTGVEMIEKVKKISSMIQNLIKVRRSK